MTLTTNKCGVIMQFPCGIEGGHNQCRIDMWQTRGGHTHYYLLKQRAFNNVKVALFEGMSSPIVKSAQDNNRKHHIQKLIPNNILKPFRKGFACLLALTSYHTPCQGNAIAYVFLYSIYTYIHRNPPKRQKASATQMLMTQQVPK